MNRNIPFWVGFLVGVLFCGSVAFGFFTVDAGTVKLRQQERVR